MNTRLSTFALFLRLPDGVSLEEGALVEPVAVAVRACKRAGIQVGSNVLICGAGRVVHYDVILNLCTAANDPIYEWTEYLTNIYSVFIQKNTFFSTKRPYQIVLS